MTSTRRPSSASDQQQGGRNNNDDPNQALLIDRNQLPRNYDAATHERRMSHLRQQQQQQQQRQEQQLQQHHHGSRASSIARRQSRLMDKQLNQPSVLRIVLNDGDAADGNNNSGNNSKKRRKQKKNNENPATTAPRKVQQQDQKSAQRGRHQQHSYLYSMLNPLSHRRQAILFKRFIATVILLDLACFIASTDPTIGVESDHGQFFELAEGAVSTIFLIEYILRIMTITEKTYFGELGPFYGRLHYAFGTAGAWIDLLATAPFFIERITGISLPTLTILRIFRLFRILKTEGYVRAMDAVYRVVYYNAAILYVASLVCVFLTMVTAVLLYLLRPDIDTEQNFTSITATLYLAVMLLTGQGGPDGELPWYTKAVVLLTSIFSVAMFAIPSSMLTWGFEAEAERHGPQALQRTKRLNDDNDDNGYDSSTSHNTTDEEYFALIAGGDEDEEEADEVEQPWMKRVREAFEAADENADGALTLEEARNLFLATGTAGVEPLTGTAYGNNDSDTTAPQPQSRLDVLEAKMDRIIQLLEDQQRLL